MLDAKKFLNWNKLRKMKSLCNWWVFVWNPCTLKEMVQFVHEVHPVFVVILSTFAHMLCGSNDDKFRKIKGLCNRWVFVWNPCTLKEMAQFVHEIHPVFAVILSTFAHMLCGSNDDTMPSFKLFWVQVVALSNFKVI